MKITLPKKPKDKPHVVAECISCKKTRKIYAHEVGSDDMPTCEDCLMPMVAKKAVS